MEIKINPTTIRNSSEIEPNHSSGKPKESEDIYDLDIQINQDSKTIGSKPKEQITKKTNGFSCHGTCVCTYGCNN